MNTFSTEDPPKRFIGSLHPPQGDAPPPSPPNHPSNPTQLAITDQTSSPSQQQPRIAKRIVGQQIPADILHNQSLNDAIAILPANYNFEIHKTVWRLRQVAARRVALQFPEGLLMYSCVISDILESFAGVEETFIMGDVAFGACCVDDYSAKALAADFLVHYGHSCLVPVSHTSIPCMYVFVDIKMDIEHFVGCVQATIPRGQRLILAGTIQFAASTQVARAQLLAHYPHITVPQSRPLSPGEVLGCTAPVVPGQHDAIVFVADGRFHLEALMIANPGVRAYRYDPYGRILTEEEYDQEGMRGARRGAVEGAMGAQVWGVVLGTLGRQGNPKILERLEEILARRKKKWVTVLLSEISPSKLTALSSFSSGGGGTDSGAGGNTDSTTTTSTTNNKIEAWVQIACPRLSIDWGDEFKVPTLNPYEAFVALGEVPGWWEPGSNDYPMDYYSMDGGAYNSSYHKAGPSSRRQTSGGAGVGSSRERIAAMLAAAKVK